MTELDALLTELSGARQRQEAAKLGMKSVLEQAKASTEYASASSKEGEATAEIDKLEKHIKELALELYRSDGEKKVHAFVQVKVFPVFKFDYDPGKAKQWALTNNTAALKLDTSKFEAAIESGDVPAEIAIVTKTEEPRAQIASKL